MIAPDDTAMSATEPCPPRSSAVTARPIHTGPAYIADGDRLGRSACVTCLKRRSTARTTFWPFVSVSCVDCCGLAADWPKVDRSLVDGSAADGAQGRIGQRPLDHKGD